MSVVLPVTGAGASTGSRNRIVLAARRLVRGRADAPAWERPALVVVLALSGALYLWNLSINGWANAFYSAAVQAGSVDWTAFLYGSSDAANAITVDKPPASLWIMALSVRALGLSPFAIMLPQALMGVATVGVLYATVRRTFSAGTALLAAGILAITPVATLIFRFNNPDALLVLLLTIASYLTIRGVETGKLRWVIWAGVMLGLGFLTKQLQAFLMLPALAGVYLWAAPRRFLVRLGYALAALGALVVAAGWWVLLVQLVPASARPYVGGSLTNSFLEVTFGYNGLGRLTGNEYGNGATLSRSTGIDRLLSGSDAGQIGWLLPAAVVLVLLSVVLLRTASRTSARRATVVLFGGSLLVTTLAFSFMAGIYHSYYTVAMAPALAGSVAMGASLLWRRRHRLWVRLTLAAITAGTSGWAFALLSRPPEFLPWLRWVVLVLGVAGAILLATPLQGKSVRAAAALIAIASMLAGPLAYSLQTAAVSHSGSGPTAGPSSGGSGQATRPDVTPQTAAALSADSSSYTWVAAVLGSPRAAQFQLATGLPVMAVGGYKCTDPSPTLEQFQGYVAERRIHWWIAGSLGGSGISASISQWVAANFAQQTVGGVLVYDLSVPPQPTATAPASPTPLMLTPDG